MDTAAAENKFSMPETEEGALIKGWVMANLYSGGPKVIPLLHTQKPRCLAVQVYNAALLN